MTEQYDRDHHTGPNMGQPRMAEHGHGSRGGHGWMMIACCTPMLAIAVILFLIGAVSPVFLIFAVVMVALMAWTMKGMGRSRPPNR